MNWFDRFARWAKRKIASPRHFVGFIAISFVWLAWAASRSFDPFSQLLLNTPTTWAEYLFEILVLASAIGAEEAAQAVLDALIENQRLQNAMLAEIKRVVEHEQTEIEQLVERP